MWIALQARPNLKVVPRAPAAESTVPSYETHHTTVPPLGAHRTQQLGPPNAGDATTTDPLAPGMSASAPPSMETDPNATPLTSQKPQGHPVHPNDGKIHALAYCDEYTLFDHWWTATKETIVKPHTEQIKCASVYTHTNIEKGSTQVWIRGPNDTAWKDVTEEYFGFGIVPHPTKDFYFLSQNRSTKFERPNFIKDLKRYKEGFTPRYHDWKK